MPNHDCSAALDEDVVAAKTQFRARGRAIRAALSESERAAASAAICTRLKSLFAEFSGNFSIYLATPDEANIDDFIAWLLARGVPVFAPRGDIFAPLESLDLVGIGKWGVREPTGPHPRPLSPNGGERGDSSHNFLENMRSSQEHQTISHPSPRRLGRGAGGEGTILVPGLLFDANGGRLGLGGGWYDRALAHFPQALKIGVAFDEQIVKKVPREAHDVMMDAVLTPSGVLDSITQNSNFKTENSDDERLA